MTTPDFSQNFLIVDVFALGKYTGNQLAVFPNAAGLETAQMQAIAREINFSESTFVTGQTSDGAYEVRIFTPQVELPFAGHPTLGTAWVLRHLNPQLQTVTLSYQAGLVPVSYDENNIPWMAQRSPEFLGEIDPNLLMPLLGLTIADLDEQYPIEQVSTGLPFIILPVKTLAAVQRAQVQVTEFLQLVQNWPGKCVLLFCPETLEPINDFHVRVFTHALGIPEDPATGSANGCLAAYLVRHGYNGQASVNYRVEQGYEIDRPSLLYLRADSGSTNVGGSVELIARGQWSV
jgi:trans-2,3-dihydro-3-hydroxyanthranilate isomerase